MLKNIAVIASFLVLSGCAIVETVEVQQEKPKETLELPEVFCSDGKFYLVYEDRKIIVEYEGAICVPKKGEKQT